jgi:hypothetical protein
MRALPANIPTEPRYSVARIEVEKIVQIVRELRIARPIRDLPPRSIFASMIGRPSIRLFMDLCGGDEAIARMRAYENKRLTDPAQGLRL